MSKRKNLESKQRFTIKKFKIGAASVLIGTVFAIFAGTVEADDSISTTEVVIDQSANQSNTVEVEKVEEVPLEIIESPEPISVEVVEYSEYSEELVDAKSVDPEVVPSENVAINSTLEAQTTSDSNEVLPSSPTNETVPEVQDDENSILSAETKKSEETEDKQNSLVEKVSGTPVDKDNKDNHTDTQENSVTETETSLLNPEEESFHSELTERENLNSLPDVNENEIKEILIKQTKAYSVEKSEKPVSSALPRPHNEGKEIPSGTGFRLGDTETPREKNLDLAKLSKQIVWVDFTDDNDIQNVKVLSDGTKALKVGTVFQKEISPGFTVKAEVIELKPFEATDFYKERTGGDPAKGYNPNAVNRYRTDKRGWWSGRPTDIILKPQDPVWSHVRLAGLSTEDRLTNFGVEQGAFNVGMRLKVTAIYKGDEVPVTILMADGEEAKSHEINIFTTNGSNWEEIATIKQDENNVRYTVNSASDLASIANGGYIPEYWANPDQVTGGLGSKVFGGVRTNKDSHSVPVVATSGATEVGIYMNTIGGQTTQIGFLLTDIGDAPASYGYVAHAIRDLNGEPAPFLGTEKPDYDVDQSDPTGSGSEWFRDDNNDDADEGDTQLSASGQPFVIHQAENHEYTLSIKANRNGNERAFVKGWIDFNNNGKFDDNESSAMIEVTSDGPVDLVFQNAPQIIDTSISALGARVRIALKSEEIQYPVDLATSGEVEDFLIKTIHPPKGERKETSGNQGEPQSTTMNFTAYGKLKTDFNTANTIDTTQAVKIVAPDGSLVTSFTKPGQGTYTVTSDGTVTFTPVSSFVGTADGVVLRATDKNGQTTGWTSNTSLNGLDNINQNINGFTTMDGVYVPTVIAVIPSSRSSETTGVQGQAQTSPIILTTDENDANPGQTINFVPGAETPKAQIDSTSITLLDSNGQATDQPVIVFDASGKKIGTFTLDKAATAVVFTPEKDFVGAAPSVSIQAADKNGRVVTATYTPTVTAVVPTGMDVTSTGPQGQVQTGQPVFNPGNDLVPMDNTVPATFEDGETIKTVDGVGTYEVSENGTVTFTPVPTYTGTAEGVTVKRVDKNGTAVTAKYTPTVTAVTPTAHSSETTGLQGIEQSSNIVFEDDENASNYGETLNFIPGANIPEGVITIDNIRLKNTNDQYTDQPVEVFTSAGMKVGTYSIDKANNRIIFTPEKDFVGVAPAIIVQASDKNGTTVEGTYTPTVKPVVPTGTDATSTGKQGQVQSGQPVFTAGDPQVPMDDNVAATFEDGSKTKTIDGEGTYTVAPDGTVTFTPEPSFTGTGTGVTVKRVDKNGTAVTAKYTPTVEKVTPTAQTAETTGKQGQAQTTDAKALFTEGDVTA
ncbi:GEVED domain-containing protein, partial [Streptococcus pacificus]